jgi:hypothetical protein
MKPIVHWTTDDLRLVIGYMRPGRGGRVKALCALEPLKRLVRSCGVASALASTLTIVLLRPRQAIAACGGRMGSRN